MKDKSTLQENEYKELKSTSSTDKKLLKNITRDLNDKIEEMKKHQSETEKLEK